MRAIALFFITASLASGALAQAAAITPGATDASGRVILGFEGRGDYHKARKTTIASDTPKDSLSPSGIATGATSIKRPEDGAATTKAQTTPKTTASTTSSTDTTSTTTTTKTSTALRGDSTLRGDGSDGRNAAAAIAAAEKAMQEAQQNTAGTQKQLGAVTQTPLPNPTSVPQH